MFGVQQQGHFHKRIDESGPLGETDRWPAELTDPGGAWSNLAHLASHPTLPHAFYCLFMVGLLVYAAAHASCMFVIVSPVLSAASCTLLIPIGVQALRIIQGPTPGKSPFHASRPSLMQKCKSLYPLHDSFICQGGLRSPVAGISQCGYDSRISLICAGICGGVLLVAASNRLYLRRVFCCWLFQGED